MIAITINRLSNVYRLFFYNLPSAKWKWLRETLIMVNFRPAFTEPKPKWLWRWPGFEPRAFKRSQLQSSASTNPAIQVSTFLLFCFVHISTWIPLTSSFGVFAAHQRSLSLAMHLVTSNKTRRPPFIWDIFGHIWIIIVWCRNS